ncbi:hypothetical protein QR680_016974 [Steinernema hermaphroditum]|uniref:Probable ATP-dependent RNA helicase DDX46 n=1 Tax=Steinernema hermaphroditum TaxID=289476 RepID=A0AA39HE13_9BILA|nr:hypothetical protein QR680_016974 [Steinernema hermaphroditum]
MGRDRDRDREKDRDKDRDRHRDRDRERDRKEEKKSRKRSRSRDRDRDRKRRDRDRRRSRSPEESKSKKRRDEPAEDDAAKEIEAAMQRRRQKVEQWKAEKAAKEAAIKEAETESNVTEEKAEEPEQPKKSWTLDDDGEDDAADVVSETEDVDNAADLEMPPLPVKKTDDDEEQLPLKNGIEKKVESAPVEEKAEHVKMEEAGEDDADPLDAYMQEINKQVRPKRTTASGKARIIKIEAPNKDGPNKGEIIETEDDREAFVDDFDLESVQNSLLAKGRHLAQTDHTMVYYRPFKKNFYVETAELAKMTKKEVEELRHSLDEIKVRGQKCPKPIKTWAQTGLPWKFLNALKKYNYLNPTPVQAQAIPAIMGGRDVISIAKTGSGKTLAFLLPMFRHIMDQPQLDEMDGPIAVILSPTRELAMQTWREATKFAKLCDLRVVCVYGGVGISEQIADLKRGAEVVVCTPGRMIDMLAANNGRVTNLRRTTYLVLDEADRMFDMGFEPQVMKIVNNIRPDRQTVLFSATFPRSMEALARKILDKPIEIMVGGRSVVCADVQQHALILEESQKMLKLLELLGVYWEHGNVIVFVDKQEKADDVVGQLMRAGYNCLPLHGGIDQFDRDSAILDFKSGKQKLLVATSVAARGLDVKKLILVVNYDCPNHYEDYVHRVGRTGRAGQKGFAYTFILPEGQERMAGEVCRAFETAGVEPPVEIKENWENFKKQMAAEGKEVHIGGGGFGGSGFKYDSNEEETEANKKRLAKIVHNMETGNDADNDADIEQQLSCIFRSKRRVVDGSSLNTPTAKTGKDAPSDDKMEKARQVAAALAANKKLGAVTPIQKDATALTAEAVMRGGEAVPVALSATSIAKQKAEQLNERLNYMPSEILPGVEKGEALRYFVDELEINDFPQQVRYRICSRDSIAQIQDYAEVGISVKGSFYPPNKEPKDGEKKLYLFLEARDELSLNRAKEEIIRIVKEAFRQLAQQNARGGPMGRYRVA